MQERERSENSMSANDAKETFSTNGENAFLYFGLNVNDSAPNDLPWYDPFIATIPFFPVNFLANFIAASTSFSTADVKMYNCR